MLFIRLAISNILRNRRSGASLAIGIFFSLLLFNALNFNIVIAQESILQDSLSRGTEIAEIQGFYYSYPQDLSNVEKDAENIEKEKGITNVNPIARVSFWNEPDTEYVILGVLESDWDSLLETKDVTISQGSTNFSLFENSSSHIPVVGFASTPKTANETIEVRDYRTSYSLDIIGWVYFDVENTVFQDESLGSESYPANWYYFITIISNMDDFDYVDLQLKVELVPDTINFNDIAGSMNQLNLLVERLNLKYPSYMFSSPLALQLGIIQLISTIFLVITLIFLIPFFFLALYISNLASELNLESRRIQYGLYLTKGLEATTIKRAYLTEGILIGAINGVLTFLLTPIAGFLLASYLPVNIPAVPIQELWFRYYINNIFQLGWSIIIGVVLGAYIMRIPFFYLRLSPNELMHRYRQEEAETTRTRGRIDVIVLLGGLYPVAVALGLYLASLFQAPPIFIFILIMAGQYALYVAPFSPFLVSYGLSSILTRQTWVLSRIATFYTRFAPNLRGLTDKMVLSKMYRISRIAFVMSLAITFIIFPLILSESLQNYTVKSADFSRGGDVRIDVSRNSSLTLETLSARPEVAFASLIQLSYISQFTTVNLNASEYVKSVYIAPFWELNEEEIVSLTSSTVLVSRNTFTDLGLKIGETITVNSTDYEIIGTFRGLGGMGLTTSFTRTIIINKQLEPSITAGSFIVKLKEFNRELFSDLYDYVSETDPGAIFDAKINVLPASEEPAPFDFVLFIIRVLDAQAVLLTFVAIGALGFLMIIRVRERTREFGTWRSRGMSNMQLIQSIIIETATIATLGFIIGLLTGGGLVLGFQGFIIGTIFQGISIVPLDIILPLGMWLLLSIMILGIVIISVIVGAWVILVPVSKQIRYEDYA
ncbi:MAG: FtsX-like permease family protein [Candidatus Hodarchaeales archaeon]|jgi:hypothetical protein